MLKTPNRVLLKSEVVKVVKIRGRGRPTEDDAADLVKVSLTLPARMIIRAGEVGNGNVSLGLRKLIAAGMGFSTEDL